MIIFELKFGSEHIFFYSHLVNRYFAILIKIPILV